MDNRLIGILAKAIIHLDGFVAIIVMVSAIITTHNRLELLKRAIQSVLSQTFTDIECIVVSDASTDGTVDYCRLLEGITFIEIRPEKSKGGNYARNVGIQASHGEYIALLDDDDAWYPTKIEKQVALIQEKKCGLVYCKRRFEIINQTTGVVEYRDSLSNFQGNLSHFIMTRIFITTSCMLFSKDLVQQIGLFDEELRYWQEYELTIRMSQSTEIFLVEEPLTLYRIDKTDTQRLTNKFDGWKMSVMYIRKKHDILYQQLSHQEFALYLNTVWQDASNRAEHSLIPSLYKYYSSLAYLSSLSNASKTELSKREVFLSKFFNVMIYPIIKQKKLAFESPVLSMTVFVFRAVRLIPRFL